MSSCGSIKIYGILCEIGEVMTLKKKIKKVNIMALMLTGLLAGVFPCMALAAETPGGSLGDVATFTGQPGEIMQIEAENKDAFEYTIVASYDKDGRMVDFELVPLVNGKAEVSLEKWGEDVKLFAVTDNHEPASPQVTWTAAAETSSEEETVWLVTTELNAVLQKANALFEPALNDECRISKDGSDVLTNRQWVTPEMYGDMKAAVVAAEEGGFATQAEVDHAVEALETAISAWKPEYGMIEPFAAEVFGIRRDFVHNQEVVESGIIAVEFDFENYREPVMFALMEHVETAEGEEHNVIVQEIYIREDESDTEGAVTFNMAGIAMGEYEVVYLEDDVWYGTSVYINMFAEDNGIVQDELDVVELDLSTSDEWRTEGYIYDLVDITFDGAEWAVTKEEFDWNEVTYWVDGEQFIWGEDSKPGDYAVETDFLDYYYDADTETGYATGLIAAYVDNVKAGETYDVEIRFPSDYLRITEEDYEFEDEETFVVDFNVNIIDSETKLTPAKDTLDTITIDVGEADDWRTEGYVYVEKEITFDGAEWFMEPNWENHVTYWIDGEQFQWIPGVSVVGEYAVEVEMVPEYDEAGNLSMKAMVFAYVENVKNGDSFDMEIKVPTYSLTRTNDNYRLTRNETAVIDFTVNIEGCEDYVAPVVDTVEDIYIDLSASDEWRTDGYLYQMFDITFNAAEFAVEGLDWENITYWVNGEQFIWDVETSKPGDFAVEADVFDYIYDEESETGYAPGLIAAYVDNVAVDEVYEVEIHFPSDQLRITEEGYGFKNGETVVVDFNVHIVDSEEKLTPAKDTLEEITVDLADTDLLGYAYAEEEVTFEGAKWIREPYWAGHVTYWINGEQFIYDWENVQPGDYALEVDLMPNYDDEGNMSMYATVYAYADKVKASDSFDVEIEVPTYSMERTDDGYRITRNETAVIDFTVNITGSAPVVEKGFSAEVTDIVPDCHIDDNDGTVTEGTITVEFTFENYKEAVRFGLMNDNGETATEKVFTRENADDTTGSVTFNMTGRPATKYEVVYQMGEEWYKTGEFIYLAIPEDAFTVTEVKGTRVDCSDDGETVESGTITVDFTFENYTDAITFGLMDHDNDDDVPVEAVFEGTDEDTGSVTFAMEGVPVAVYEVVYYLADVGKWVGTGTDIDLTAKEAETNIVLTKNGDQVTASWDELGYENYTWTFEDHTGDVVELQWTKRGECVSYNMMPILPKVENGSESYDFVLYECDKTDEDWIGKELGRLEDAIVVTAEGSAVVYTMEVTDAANGTYEVTLEETPGNGDLYLTEWSRGKSSYCSVYSSDGSMTFEETAFMNNGLAEGDIYDLRKASFDVTDNQLNVTMTPASETAYTVEEEPANEVNFTLNYSNGKYYLTWNDVGYEKYQVRILDGDTKVLALPETNRNDSSEFDLLHFIPCADEDKSYDIVLREQDGNKTILARLEDALVVTVSGSKAEYSADFSATGVTATWVEKPSGVSSFFELERQDGQIFIGGSTPVPDSVIVNTTLTGGEVLDLRVVTEASLDGQVLSVVITPASKTTYVAEGEDEPTTDEMSVTVALNKDTVVVNPEKGPYVQFSFENLTEATTISTYVVTTKGASEAEAIEVKTQDITAGTQYATIGLYSATFNEVGTYYVYYRVGNDIWCDVPLEIIVKQPEVPTVNLQAGYIKGTAGEAISKDVVITLKNDAFKNTMVAGTDVTDWFTNMPADWTATVKQSVASGAVEMTVTIACAADKTVTGNGGDGPDGFAGLTVPAEYLTGGNALTATETFAYKVN